MQEFPNLLTGTFSSPGFSTGNTLPLVARPFGFNHWSLHNSPQENSWWFEPNHHEFRYLRLTHQPSPWISDWAWLRFGPQMGPLTQYPTMFFEPRAAHLKPYGMDVRQPRRTRDLRCGSPETVLRAVLVGRTARFLFF
jgi:putative alpha-1,2-mannosidase